jgi:hypothetical protein
VEKDGEFFQERMDLIVTTSSCVYHVDVSVVHPLAAMHMYRDDKDSGPAIEERERSKKAKYKAAGEQLDAETVPFVVDAYGRFGRCAQNFIDICGRTANGTGRFHTAQAFKNQAYAALSAAIQVGNARAAIHAFSSVRVHHFNASRAARLAADDAAHTPASVEADNADAPAPPACKRVAHVPIVTFGSVRYAHSLHFYVLLYV